MTGNWRVVEKLNEALHSLLRDDAHTYFIGEDLLDPYGGAFTAARGLSTAFPRQVLSTPISEQAVMGVAAGMALCGDRVIVEVMFGDFITLGYDPLVNFITKSVGMYGRPVQVPVVVRCPVGGQRGYGATHSQNMQKHLLGVPHLTLHELSPFHEPRSVLARALERGEPTVFFEDKVLYTRPWVPCGAFRDHFTVDTLDDDGNWVRVRFRDSRSADVAVIAAGGAVYRVMEAMEQAMIDEEVESVLVVPSRIDPMDLSPALAVLAASKRVIVVDDGVAGHSWGEGVAHAVQTALWGGLPEPVRVVQPVRATIPAAAHLEAEMLVSSQDIARELCGVDRA